MAWWKYVLGVSVILIGTCALYVPVLGGGFLWDDDVWLNDSPFTTADDGILRVWFTRKSQDYWPLTSSAFWVQYRLWGDNPDGYRAVNVVLHALGAVCLWMVFRALKLPGAWLGALLFAIHPVCVASVGWIAELKNTLSMLLAALALLAYLRFDAKRSQLYFGLSLAAFALALAAKTSILMLPAVFLIAAWYRRRRITGSDLWPLIPFAVIAAFMAIMTIIYQHAQTTAMNRVQSVAVLERVGIAARALWFYLFKSLAPIGMSMNYRHWNTNPLAPVPLAAICAVLAGALILARRHQGWRGGVAAALAAFAAMLLPVLGFVSMSFMQFAFVSDHLQYVGLPAIMALAAAGIWRLGRWRRGGLWAAVAIAIVTSAGLSVQTARRAHVFKNSKNLWTDTLARNPKSWLAHNGLGVEFNDAGDNEAALAEYLDAVKLNPGYADGQSNLAKSYAERGLDAHQDGRLKDAQTAYAQACVHFKRAADLGSRDVGILHEWGNTLVRAGRLNEADAVLTEALEADPNHAGVHLQLGLSAYNRGRTAKAVKHYRRAMKLRPDWEKPLINLVWILITEASEQATDPGEAVRLARRAAEVAEENRFRAHLVLAEAEAQTGDFAAAQAAAREALEVATTEDKPKEADVARRLLDVYAKGLTYFEHAAIEARKGQANVPGDEGAAGP